MPDILRATWIPDLLTPLSREMAQAAIHDAVGDSASPVSVAILTAHSALETGRWKSIHRYNFGNVKCSENWVGLFTTFACNELIAGKLQWFAPEDGQWQNPPGHPQTRFRAFSSATQGAEDHLNFLKRSRYAQAWGLAQAGDPIGFVHALHDAGYFTAPVGPYARGVDLLTAEYLHNLEPNPEANQCIKNCARIELLPMWDEELLEDMRDERDATILQEDELS
jgi:hypothetical protein